MIMNNPNLENLLRNVLQAQGTIKETFIDTYLRKTGCKISECALVEKTDMDEGVIKYWVEKRSDMERAECTPQINKDLLAACEKQKEAIDMLMAMLIDKTAHDPAGIFIPTQSGATRAAPRLRRLPWND